MGLDQDLVLHQLPGRLAHKDHTGASPAPETTSQGGRLPGGRVDSLWIRPKPADDHHPRVHSDPDHWRLSQWESSSGESVVQLLLQGDGRQDGSPGMILLGYIGPK